MDAVHIDPAVSLDAARPSPPPRSTYRHGDLRRALLEAGIDLAREGGPDAVVLREATRRASFTVEVDRAENIDAVQKTILDALQQEPLILKAPAATVEVETLGPLSTTLTVRAWFQNRAFGAGQSALKRRVRAALNAAHVNAPVPVGPPAVAPWTPEPEQAPGNAAQRPG